MTDIIENPGSQIIAGWHPTGLEKAMADADAERLMAMQAELVRAVWSPYDIPIEFLPYLAWSMGVNYWNDGWSEITKRNWVARQWEFKSLRGTEAAVSMAVDYAGRDVSQFGYDVLWFRTQPQKIYSGKSLTKDEREAWLENLPQVRVTKAQVRGVAPAHKSFAGGSNATHQHDHRFCFSNYFVPSNAIERLGRRATWVVDGVETNIKITEYGSYFQAHLTGNAGVSAFCNTPMSVRYFMPSSAANRLITIEPSPVAQPWRTAATPTWQAVTLEPERIAVPGVDNYRVFSHLPVGKRYFAPTSAPQRIYERYAVNNGVVPVGSTKHPVQFMGVGRYGAPKFTAVIGVAFNGRVSKYAAGTGFYNPGTKFFLKHDGRPMQRVREALMASKRLHDRILIKSGRNVRTSS